MKKDQPSGGAAGICGAEDPDAVSGLRGDARGEAGSAPAEADRVRTAKQELCETRTSRGGADIIVCWEHNWEDCPLEVIELRKVIE